MAANPFLKTSEMYNPFAQKGDDSGSNYGFRMRGIMNQFGDLGVQNTTSAPAPAPRMSNMNQEPSRQGDNDSGPAINEYTGDFFSMTPGPAVGSNTQQKSIVDDTYGAENSYEPFSWGGLIGGIAGGMTPIPGGALMGYHAGKAIANYLDPEPAAMKRPGTATPDAQPLHTGSLKSGIGTRQPGQMGPGQVKKVAPKRPGTANKQAQKSERQSASSTGRGGAYSRNSSGGLRQNKSWVSTRSQRDSRGGFQH